MDKDVTRYYRDVAQTLSDRLDLRTPPVALSFVTERPAGVDRLEEPMPSSCAFWRAAEARVFYASADEHFNCPIGAMVMGFELPGDVQDELRTLVGDMCECDYISDDEPAGIPSVEGDKAGIVYGPLAELPIRADLILLWLTPRQAMLMAEAVEFVSWKQDPGARVFGRPACSALPLARRESHATLSFGCTGMRTFTEIGDDRALGVIPGERIEEFVERLEAACDVNETMRRYYEQRRKKLSS